MMVHNNKNILNATELHTSFFFLRFVFIFSYAGSSVATCRLSLVVGRGTTL